MFIVHLVMPNFHLTSLVEKLTPNHNNMTTTDIPKQQKAAVRVGNGESARAPAKQIDVRTPGPDEILVKLTW